MPETRLTRPEFAAALRRGHGRALQHVRQHGLSGVADLVLEACLKDPAFDRQCEGPRTTWLFQLFEHSALMERFSTAILAELSTLPADADAYDLEHLCGLTSLMAQAGNDAAADTLRRRVLNQDLTWPNTPCGCQPLVALDGVPALIALARRFGQLLKEAPDDRPPSVEFLTEDLGIFDEADTALRQLAETDEDIKRYLENEDAHEARSRASQQRTSEEQQRVARERARQGLTLEGILHDASREAGDNAVRYMRFGRYATADELAIVLQRLIKETREAVCLRLLWVFRRARLPELHPRVWQLADAENEPLRRAAIEALAQHVDPRIGELGRKRLRSGGFTAGDAEVLELLIRNYHPQDEPMIMAALAPLSPDEDEAHRLGSSMLDICTENTDAPCLDMLTWVYEFTPCSICRYVAVKQLAERGMLPQAIAHECLDDADEDVRDLARVYGSSDAKRRQSPTR